MINAGCPGHPSTALALELPSLLERYQPGIVIALGGINDRWDERGRAEVLKLTGASWNPLRQSRLLKLSKIIHTRIVTKREVSLSDPDIESRYLAPKHDAMLVDAARRRQDLPLRDHAPGPRTLAPSVLERALGLRGHRRTRVTVRAVMGRHAGDVVHRWQLGSGRADPLMRAVG